MATISTKRQAVVKIQVLDLTPVIERTVRRSSRDAPDPKRHQYSAEESTPETTKKRRRVKAQSIRHETQEEGAENSHVEPERDPCGPSSSKAFPHIVGAVSSHGAQRGLSAYELERLENIRQNQAFLSSINLLQAPGECRHLKQPKPSQRGLERSPAPANEAPPVRKSRRLQKKEAEFFTLPPEPRVTLIDEQPRTPKKPAGPLPMQPVNEEEGSKLPSELVGLCRESIEERKVVLDLKEYCSVLKNMRITESSVAKVVKNRILSADFHPCNSSFLMAAGDFLGNIGLWKLGSDWGDDGVLLFEPHTRPVPCLRFSRVHGSHLLSLSDDGSLRCMDVEKAVFDDVYDVDDRLKTFDFMSHDCLTLVVGNWFGEVAIVDRRTPGNSHESIHSLDTKTLRCISVHPLQKHYFAVSESQTVSIYDSRCLKKSNSQAVSKLLGHSSCISSAYFSPCTGNRVLTSCMDDQIRIYDTSTMVSHSPLLKRIRRVMQTGRWLSKISAVWDPKQEDCFAVGSMLRPRRVQVYHVSGQLQHTFMDNKILSTVLPVNVFHPTRNALLGGNASGRLHVFSD